MKVRVMKKTVLSLLILSLSLSFLFSVELTEISFSSLFSKEYKKAISCSNDTLLFILFSYEENNNQFLALDMYNHNMIKVNQKDIIIDKNGEFELLKIKMVNNKELFIHWSKSENKSFPLPAYYSLNLDLTKDLNDRVSLENHPSGNLNRRILYTLDQGRFISSESDDFGKKIQSFSGKGRRCFQNIAYYNKSQRIWIYKIPEEYTNISLYNYESQDSIFIVYTSNNNITICKINNKGELLNSYKFQYKTDDEMNFILAQYKDLFILDQNIVFWYEKNLSTHILSLTNDFKLHKLIELDTDTKISDLKKIYYSKPDLKLCPDRKSLSLSYLKSSINNDDELETSLLFLKLNNNLDSEKRLDLFIDKKKKEYFSSISNGTSVTKSIYMGLGYNYHFKKKTNEIILLTKQYNEIEAFKINDFNTPVFINDKIHLNSMSFSQFDSISNIFFLSDHSMTCQFNNSRIVFNAKTFSLKDFSLKNRLELGRSVKGKKKIINILENKKGYFVFWILNIESYKNEFNYFFLDKDLKLQSSQTLYTGSVNDHYMTFFPTFLKKDSLKITFQPNYDKVSYDYQFDEFGRFISHHTTMLENESDNKNTFQTEKGFIRFFLDKKSKRWLYDLSKGSLTIKKSACLDSLKESNQVNFNQNYLTFFRNDSLQFLVYGAEDEFVPMDHSQFFNFIEGKKYKNHFLFLKDNSEYFNPTGDLTYRHSLSLIDFDLKKQQYTNLLTAKTIKTVFQNDSLVVLSQSDSLLKIEIYGLKKKRKNLISKTTFFTLNKGDLQNYNLVFGKNEFLLFSFKFKELFTIKLAKQLSVKDQSDMFNDTFKKEEAHLFYDFKDRVIIPVYDKDSFNLLILNK